MLEKSCLKVFVVKMKLKMRVVLVLGGWWEGHYRSKYSETSCCTGLFVLERTDNGL